MRYIHTYTHSRAGDKACATVTHTHTHLRQCGCIAALRCIYEVHAGAADLAGTHEGGRAGGRAGGWASEQASAAQHAVRSGQGGREGKAQRGLRAVRFEGCEGFAALYSEGMCGFN